MALAHQEDGGRRVARRGCIFYRSLWKEEPTHLQVLQMNTGRGGGRMGVEDFEGCDTSSYKDTPAIYWKAAGGPDPEGRTRCDVWSHGILGGVERRQQTAEQHLEAGLPSPEPQTPSRGTLPEVWAGNLGLAVTPRGMGSTRGVETAATTLD